MMSRAKLFQLQHRFAPHLFLAPFLLLFTIFVFYPLSRSLTLSFYSTVSGPRHVKFIGLANYQFLLHDRLFWGSVLNTACFAAGLLLLQMPIALGLAILLNLKALRFRAFFRFCFFSTYLVGGVVGAILFALLLDPRRGLLNTVLGLLLRRQIEINWLGNPNLAMISVLLAALWLSVGFAMIYLLAGLQSIDLELYEAAQVDGASHWQRFLHITLPGIRPVLAFLMVVGTIGAFQLFELPYVLFRQSTGPNSRGLTVVMYLFQTGFQAGDFGYASAVGWMLVLIIFAVSLVQLRLMRQKD